MTLQEAQQSVVDNQHLIGTIFEGDEISELVIVPIDDSNLTEIIMHLNLGEGYGHFLIGHKDFYVSVFLNFDQYPNEGYLLTLPLDHVLKSLSEE